MSISISEKARLTIFADKNEAGRVGKAGSSSHPTFYQNTMEKKIILI